MSSSALPPPRRLSGVDWLILILAALGFAFDIYELLMLQFVLRPAVVELVGVDLGSPAFTNWRQLLFFVPMLLGGFFGLIGGYLTDYLGRRRMLTFSILLYALSAFAAGLSTSIYQLLFWRCLTLIGVCIEFVAAVAWLAELFPNPRQREAVLGYTQAFSSIGGLLAAAMFGLLVSIAPDLPAVRIPDFLAGVVGQIGDVGAHAPWRYMLMSGILPALPLIFIRPFLPESPIWQKRKAEGTLKRPSVIELFSPELRRTTLLTTVMVACGYGVALGCIQQVPQMVVGLPEVRDQVKNIRARHEVRLEELKTLPSLTPSQRAERARLQEAPRLYVQEVSSTAGKIQEIGGLVGRFLLAYLAVNIICRRRLLWCFVIPGLVVAPVVFAGAATMSLTWLYFGIFLVGLFTVAQFSFWGNYLPRVYPLHLRGTGESFAANVGGRILGTSAVLLTTAVEGLFPATNDPAQAAVHLAYAAAIVAGLLYAGNLILSFFLPQPNEAMMNGD